MIRILSLIVFTLTAFHVSAQEKFEREFRVKERDVPKEAVKWFRDAFEGAKKVNWYYEQSAEKNSYEAKLEYKGLKYSVEFDTTGVIEDIEITVDWNEIPLDTRTRLEAYFDANYSKYRCLKIQKQYTGSPDDLEDLIDENEMESITVRYEIEFHGKTENDNEIWEGLFDAAGNLEELRKVKQSPTNNLLF